MTLEFDPAKALELLSGLEDLQSKLSRAVRHVKEACTCPDEYKAAKEQYHEGSYYDRAYTEKWFECSICGKRFDKKTETHSWYG